MNDNKSTKKSILTYLVIGLLVVVISIILIFLFGKLSVVITNKANTYYRALYEENVSGFSSPWYVDGLHKVDESFIYNLEPTDSNCVYVIGSSLSSNAVDDATLSLDNQYEIKNLVCGYGCYRSDRIFVNLAEHIGLIKSNDIVKYEISYTSFRDSDMTITESVLNKWGKYTVDSDDLSIKEGSVLLSPVYDINVELLKIQNSWELLMSWYDQKKHPDRYPLPSGLGNFKNNYFNYETVASGCHYTDEYKDSVLEDLTNLNSKYNLVVEISPLPDGLLKTEYGTQYNECVENELIPFLEENGIRYRDLRFKYSDDMFIDGVHMSHDAAINYTKELNEYLNDYIHEINK